MTLTDTFLNSMAGVIVGESFSIPSHVGFSSTAITINPTDTSLSGEHGDRVSVANSRTLNRVVFTGVRSGAIASSSGDSLNSFGLFSSSAGGNLYSEALVASLLQTSDFDVEVEWQVSVERKN